ncbi:phytoene desaturase family protein [Gracilibacillus massiliensis]|uniref:phytoene desaturase family protein n=1 Tax=Gracilibacillus massiliensis TaxID=1564956 RepID=UPI00071D1568|nr:phytoene desaturase family protein [Gracilibacillus massiliensis]
MKKVIIVGAGLGGLSAAITLAYHGYRVEILEKNKVVGGKLQERNVKGYHFDLGPSTITMKHVFEELFAQCGRNINDYLTFYPIKAGTMNYFDDGSAVPTSTIKQNVQKAIAQYSKEDAEQYLSFLNDSETFYQIAESQFLNRLLYRFSDKWSPTLIKNFAKIKPFTTYQDWLKQYFTHPNTLQLFGRYATYVGSSPYQTPAIYGMMAHVETNLGIYGVTGGTYQIANAMRQLAEELGVQIHYQQEVTKMVVQNSKVIGVEVDEEKIYADQVVANIDALTVYDKLLPTDKRNVEKIEPSLSGFALLLGINKRFDKLQHHQVYFTNDYQKEFDQLFKKKELVDDPTIYICNSGYDDLSLIPNANASNLFVLVNTPSETKHDWETIKNRYTDHLLDLLEQKGLTNLRDHIEYLEVMTPKDLKHQTGAFQGAIYGASSNSFKQAFFRLPNKAKEVDRLWFVGGSTHPGGGTPIVTRSGKLVAEAIIKEGIGL